MSTEAVASTEITEIAPRVSEFKRFRKVFFSRLVVKIGMVIILMLVIVAIFAPVLAPFDPYKPDLLHRHMHHSIRLWDTWFKFYFKRE